MCSLNLRFWEVHFLFKTQLCLSAVIKPLFLKSLPWMLTPWQIIGLSEILLFLWKVFGKKIVLNQLLKYLTSNVLLEPFQSAFWVNHSTETAPHKGAKWFIVACRLRVSICAIVARPECGIRQSGTRTKHQKPGEQSLPLSCPLPLEFIVVLSYVKSSWTGQKWKHCPPSDVVPACPVYEFLFCSRKCMKPITQ